MGLDLEQIIAQERAGILAEMRTFWPFIAMNDVTEAMETPTTLRSSAPLELQPFEGGYVQTCRAHNYKSFWAATDDKQYRKHYGAFLKAHHGLDVANSAAAGAFKRYHVDHMFNKARAKSLGGSEPLAETLNELGARYRYIRMFLIEPGANMSHGSVYEGPLSQSERYRHVRGSRMLDLVNYMKFCGIKAPRRNAPLDPWQLGWLSRIAPALGTTPVKLEGEIQELVAKAYSGWAARP
jgi:hypothetical protein